MLKTRYGIFLRPDPATCWAVSQITLAVARQFGFVAGAVFAPHATLVGNLNISGGNDPAKDEAALISAIARVLSATHPFTVYNLGVRADERRSIRYDIDLDSSGTDRNHCLFDVAERVKAAVQPLHLRHRDYLAPNVEHYVFRGHLSLASFDLEVRPDTFDEIFEFVRDLPVQAPPSFTARWFSLFRFDGDWDGRWWNTMTWDHVVSWEARS